MVEVLAKAEKYINGEEALTSKRGSSSTHKEKSRTDKQQEQSPRRQRNRERSPRKDRQRSSKRRGSIKDSLGPPQPELRQRYSPQRFTPPPPPPPPRSGESLIGRAPYSVPGCFRLLDQRRPDQRKRPSATPSLLLQPSFERSGGKVFKDGETNPGVSNHSPETPPLLPSTYHQNPNRISDEASAT